MFLDRECDLNRDIPDGGRAGSQNQIEREVDRLRFDSDFVLEWSQGSWQSKRNDDHVASARIKTSQRRLGGFGQDLGIRNQRDDSAWQRQSRGRRIRDRFSAERGVSHERLDGNRQLGHRVDLDLDFSRFGQDDRNVSGDERLESLKRLRK